jgi:OmpA family
VLKGNHLKKPEISAGRRWGGRLGLAGTVAAVTAVVVISLDGTTPPATLNPTQAAVTAPVPTTAAPALTSTTQPQRGPWFLPDGSVLPALLIYNGSTTTLAGALPSHAALDRLRELARSYSLNPHARIINQVLIDPAIPASVGLRVIETAGQPFDEGSAIVTPDYGPELARVVAAMKAMPNLTLLVIGHADQTGGGPQNVEISEERADAVVSYLISQGVNAGRMSARGVGADDPLTTQSNEQGLALNRRTEFIFYGLFANPGR